MQKTVCMQALEILDELVIVGSQDVDLKNKVEVARRLKGAISSKISGYEDMLAALVAEACIDVLPKNPVNFNVDNVRVVKIPGAALPDSMASGEFSSCAGTATVSKQICPIRRWSKAWCFGETLRGQ